MSEFTSRTLSLQRSSVGVADESLLDAHRRIQRAVWGRVGDPASVERNSGSQISTDESLLGGLVVAINDSPYTGEWFSAESIERLSVVMPLTPQAAS